MITPAKLTFFSTLYLLVFALIPGLTADFLLVPERAHPTTLAACALFMTGILFGSKVASYSLYSAPSGSASKRPTGAVSQLGLLLLGTALLVMTAYIVKFGPLSPVLAAASGYDILEVAIIREEAIKLNADGTFVRAYSYTRDFIAPAAFVMALVMLRQRTGNIAMNSFCVVLLCAASFIGVWSGQKATIINYILAAAIFLTRDARTLMRFFVVAAPALALALFAIFLATYPDTFTSANTSKLLQDVGEGLLHRLFISPFEVSIAYIDAIDNQGLINWLDTIPVFGAMLRPGVSSVENVIGTHYFYSGIDSISANALCFAYTYIVGGLSFCLLVGALTSAVLILSIRFVQTGGNQFISSAFQAILVYKLLDLLAGNPLSYLIGIIQLALLAWLLARACKGISAIRVPAIGARLPGPR